MHVGDYSKNEMAIFLVILRSKQTISRKSFNFFTTDLSTII